jgi:hypothetical protein
MVMIDAAPPDVMADAQTIDAMLPAIDTSCAGNPAPTTAPPTITLAGNVQEISISNSGPVADATVAAVNAANDQTIASDVSEADGGFSIDLATGGTPVNAYASLTKAGYRRTVVYPPAPLDASFDGLPAPVVTPMTFDLISGFTESGNPQNDAANGALLILVTDCAGAFVNGATVTAVQGGNPVGEIVDLTAFADGAYAFINVPAGTVTVNATYNGTTFRAHDVKAFANSSEAPNGTITATLIQPGYADL